MTEQQSASTVDVQFDRRRAILWVCDVAGSSRGLNDPKTVDATEEFLKRFFWLSAVLIRQTGGRVAKWTGDGFLAAYEIVLDREQGPVAGTVLDAAWYLTGLVNLTQLGVKSTRRFRIRHGVAFEPDAIFVSHSSGSDRSTDVIGRGVVLAFRLSGLKADFPSIVTQRRVVCAARDAGFHPHFRKLRLGSEDLLKHFKGQSWGTTEIYASTDERPRRGYKSAIRNARRAVNAALDPASKVFKDPEWLLQFLRALQSGPPWAQDVYLRFQTWVRDELLASLIKVLQHVESPEGTRSEQIEAVPKPDGP